MMTFQHRYVFKTIHNCYIFRQGMLIHALKDTLMHVQTVSIEKTPSTKRQYVDETPNVIQHETKRT